MKRCSWNRHFAPMKVRPGVAIRLMRTAVPITICLAGIGHLSATSFNVNFDPSTSSAPADFFTAFNYAIAFYQSTFPDPITINLDVGWGEIAGSDLNPGNLGQSRTNQQGFYSYSQIRSALVADAKSNADSLATANLGTLDPTSGRPFVMSNAEAKALGLLAGNAATVNGWVDSEVLRHSPLIRTTERSQISTTLSVWRNTRSQKSWVVMVSRRTALHRAGIRRLIFFGTRLPTPWIWCRRRARTFRLTGAIRSSTRSAALRETTATGQD